MDLEEFDAAFALAYGNTMSWSVSDTDMGGVALVVDRPPSASGWRVIWAGRGSTVQEAFEQMVKFFVEEGFK